MLKKVNKGEKFTPSASWHNTVTDTVNAMNGFQSGGVNSGRTFNITVNVENSIGEDIPANAPIVIENYNAQKDIFKIRKFTTGDSLFGVVTKKISKNEIGIAVLVGVIVVPVVGDAKKYIIPVPDTYNWRYSDAGLPVLSVLNGFAVALIYPNAFIQEGNSRPFWGIYNAESGMIDITGGNVLANGEAMVAKDDSLGVQNGYICVTAELLNGEYKEPTFVYGDFAPNRIPIARVFKDDNGVQIVNYYVSTAVLIETEAHPPCDCVGGV